MWTNPFIQAASHVSKGRILVIDDEQTVRRLLERFLTRENFKVSTVDNGKEAVELIKMMNPDVILLDVRMPDMDGMEVLKAIRQFDQNVGIVMLTGVSDLDRIKQAIAMGANDYLFKPFDLPYLLTYLGKYLQERVQRLSAAELTPHPEL